MSFGIPQAKFNSVADIGATLRPTGVDGTSPAKPDTTAVYADVPRVFVAEILYWYV